MASSTSIQLAELQEEVKKLRKEVELLKCNQELILVTKNTNIIQIKKNRAAQVYQQSKMRKLEMLKQITR